ncbi:NAD(P)-dependent oxidoreductase [Burkholderia sp. BCCIQ04A]|uniref:NAD(P)-dependent oxidoreductase n=1 Tax=Burkholderia anthinoferrum TaxID=3090833 RepID=A0ABU5WQG5_9BURK|nr:MULTISPECIES: NAD(P)-dependent oxidoreductase [Burkholderia]MEB2504837.1 NAD(P)-dependent oxidoreductase [Burkholderia anthinoferrum]MEB2533900.1 NAD(P)-dependent oxidoreductase [Burkholderia anthinoferrum]MEB2562290.1 NAD(P)-dependent oxidoreductase [Burkholderia anthinoferrum]MEB2581216.1 NAD(P)-dependent oxidoreductase [Burkholderia anthinoferrum]KVH02559.1 UDP-glucose 4-epimerase [Burkholderia anthina]
MTTLITGAGLIGRMTARRLRAHGERVLLADIRQPLPDDLGDLPLVQLDVTDWQSLSNLIRAHRVHSIAHTAAMLTPAVRRDPLTGVRVNVMGTTNVLEAARQFELRRVVIASSTTVMYSAFGSLPGTPLPEDFSYRIVSERPASIYACTKVANEHLALAYAQQYAVDAVVLRYGAVLGTGSEAASSVPGQMLDCLLRAVRSGEPARFEDDKLLWGGREEFIDVRDCATATVAALHAKQPAQRVYNVATGEWFTFAEFVEAVRRRFGTLQVADVRLPSGGLSGFPFQRPAPSDVEAAWRELAFRARYSLDDTLANIVGIV